jgi:RNA polymerase sigma-70 factor, ECF subfamily
MAETGTLWAEFFGWVISVTGECYTPEILKACRSLTPATEQAKMSSSSQDITQLLQAWRQGQEAALEELLPLVHQELRRLARRHMLGERLGHTLQATALVNEAYLRLVNSQKVNWKNRAHFFAVSAQLMRRILVDAARSRGYQKRGGGAVKVTFEEELMGAAEKDHDLLALDDALKVLAEVDPRKSRVVELRSFGGLDVKETAEVLDVSPETVMRDWRLAKAWLKREMSRGRARFVRDRLTQR